MQPQPAPQTSSSTTQAVPESEAIARDIKEGNLGGFVGNNTHLTGDASFKGMMRVDGHLSGRITSGDGTLIVSTNGRVDANVEVAIAQIYGTVNGDIIATKRIEMGRTAKVTGNIQTPTLAIEQGAIFEGSCRMVQLKEQAEKGADAASASASTSAASASSSTSGASKPGSSRSSYSSPSSSSDASAASDVTDATDVAS